MHFGRMAHREGERERECRETQREREGERERTRRSDSAPDVFFPPEQLEFLASQN